MKVGDMYMFKLGLFCYDTGTMVSNTLKTVHGDYEKIAFVTNDGTIHWHMATNAIPADVIATISKIATEYREQFLKQLDTYSVIDQYDIILNRVPFDVSLKYLRDKRPIAEKLEELRGRYYATGFWG